MGRESQIRTLAPNLTLLALKMWAYSSKNRQNWYFLVKICPKGVYPHNRFLPNLAWRRVSQICTLTPNFSVVALKMWIDSPKIGNFWYIFARKGYIPLSNFYKIWHGEDLPAPIVTPTFTIVGLKMWPYGRQNRQKYQFLV